MSEKINEMSKETIPVRAMLLVVNGKLWCEINSCEIPIIESNLTLCVVRCTLDSDLRHALVAL